MSAAAISRPIAYDVVQGLAHSRFLRATLLTGLSVGALFALYSAPPAWLVAAVATGTLALAY